MKRLFLLMGLFVTFATPNFAQTKTDTIRFTTASAEVNRWGNTYIGISAEPNTMIEIIEENTIIYTYSFETDVHWNSIPLEILKASTEYKIYATQGKISGFSSTNNYGSGILYSLDISDCVNLVSIDCHCGDSYGELISINASGCTSLTSLNCYHNQITNLNIRNCSALETLNCSRNKLRNLDISDCTFLTNLSCFENQLTSLDLNNCSGLKYLDCSENRIPLSMIYDWSKINDSISIYASEQSDSITLRINQPLDLSSERLLGEILSTFELSAYHQTLTSDYWKENNFIFRFLKPLQYTLTIYNSGVNQRQEYDNDDYYSYEDASFTWYITVIDEVQEGTFTVQVATNNPEWGTATITGNGTYEEGANVTITAKAKDGYRFANWTDGEDVFSTEAVHSFTVTENLELVANFEKIPDDVANENRKNDNFTVYVQDRMIRLSENRGAVQVFNTAGQCIYSGISTRIPVPHSGVYIVKIGTQNYKVIVL